ncbi:energy transducer TonB [Telluribacter sp. SYSU D00476]|uniref:energy transducer TonB n=1 Tax=Telluribacter sp. SYSU D00476 TaxID=2811430 RepID=UPI001FF3E943|nr:energy transducer TonB [Telluribacter sp. SYSU D00476]
MNQIITLCFCCLLCISFKGLCQTDTLYCFYDGDWTQITDSSRAEYKRVVYNYGNEYWHVIDYYKNGQVYKEGRFLEEGLKKPHGIFEEYYPSGRLESKMTFMAGRPINEAIVYYENGQIDIYRKYNNMGSLLEERYYKEDGSESIVEKPEFPGGISAMYNYLSANIKYPKSLGKKNIMGRVVVTFVVETDGSLQDIAIRESPHDAFSKEALRVVKSMPQWKPGARDQKAVQVKFNLPVNFSLQ